MKRHLKKVFVHFIFCLLGVFLCPSYSLGEEHARGIPSTRQEDETCHLYPEQYSKRDSKLTSSPFSSHEMTGIDLAQEFLEPLLKGKEWTTVLPVTSSPEIFRSSLQPQMRFDPAFYRSRIDSYASPLSSLVEDKPMRTSISAYLASPLSTRSPEKAGIYLIEQSYSDEEEEKISVQLSKSKGLIIATYNSNISNNNFLGSLKGNEKLLVIGSPVMSPRGTGSRAIDTIWVPYIESQFSSAFRPDDRFFAVLVAGLLADAKSFLPELDDSTLKLVLRLTANDLGTTGPDKNLNAYRFIRVLDRLKNECKGKDLNACILNQIKEGADNGIMGSTALLDFKNEGSGYVKEAKSILEQFSPSCESRKRAFHLLRKAHFLDPSNKHITDLVASLYGQWRYPENQSFYKYQDRLVERFTHLEEWKVMIENEDKYSNRYGMRPLVDFIYEYNRDPKLQSFALSLMEGEKLEERRAAIRLLGLVPLKVWPRQIDMLEMKLSDYAWLETAFINKQNTTPKEMVDIFDALERKWKVAASLPENNKEKEYLIQSLSSAFSSLSNIAQERIRLKDGRTVTSSALQSRLIDLYVETILHSPSLTTRTHAMNSLNNWYGGGDKGAPMRKKAAFVKILRQSNDETVLSAILSVDGNSLLTSREKRALILERVGKGDVLAKKVLMRFEVAK